MVVKELTTVSYLLGVFFRLWIPFLVRISYLVRISTSNQRALQLTESCLQIQKWCPYKARGVVPEPVCANKVRNGPATANQGSSLASQGSCHVHGTPGWTHPPPPIPPFLLWSSHCRPRLFSSQPRQLPCAWQSGVNPPTSPYPAFFASEKPIVKTDCANW